MIAHLENYKSAREFLFQGSSSSNQALRRHLTSLFASAHIQKELRSETAKVIIFNLLHFQGHKVFKVDRDKTLPRFRKAFDAMIAAGYLENLGHSRELRLCTRYRFTKTLVSMVKTPLKLQLHAYAEVYRKKKDLIEYRALKDHARFAVIEGYIELMKGTDLRTDQRVFHQLDLSMAFGEELKTLGRIYHQVQTVKKDERSSLLIDGEKTVECDIVGCHLRFLYALAGESSFNGKDPYTAKFRSSLFGDAESEEKAKRKLSKVALLTLINAKSPQSAFKSILNPTENRYWDLRKRAVKAVKNTNGDKELDQDELMTLVSRKLKEEVTTLVDALKELNIAISPFLATSAAGLLQYFESETLINVMKRLTNLKIKHITIHDAVVVSESNKELVQQILNDELDSMISIIIANRGILGNEYKKEEDTDRAA